MSAAQDCNLSGPALSDIWVTLDKSISRLHHDVARSIEHTAHEVYQLLCSAIHPALKHCALVNDILVLNRV